MTDAGPSRRLIDAVARRPAAPATLLLAAGILAHDVIPPWPRLWLAVVACLAVLALWQVRRPLFATLSLAAAVFCLGLAAAQLDAFYFPRDAIDEFTDDGERLAEIELRLSDPPHTSGGVAELRPLPLKQVVTADATAVKTLAGWRPTGGRVVLSVEPPSPRLAAGQVVRVLGWLSRPTRPMNPGEFDAAAYDRRERVLACVRVNRVQNVRILRDTGPPALARLRDAARRLLAEGFTAAHSRDHALLRLLLLGDPDPQLNDLRDEFALTGAAYQLSISGLHIAILGGAALLLLRLARAGPRRAVWVATAFVALYAAVALPSAAGLRSLAMCCCGAAGVLGRRSVDGLQMLSVAVCAILLAHPADLYGGGFQIGAAAVLGLILFGPPVGRSLRRLTESDDPWINRHPDVGVVRAAVAAAGHFIGRTLLVSTIVWVVVMPLVAYHFEQVNPWAVPGGALLLPATVLALLAGAMKVLLTLAWPGLATTWAALATGPAALLRHGVDALAHLPGAEAPTAPPRVWEIVAYYAFLLAPLVPWRRAAARWAARFAPVTACAVVLIFPLAAAPARPAAAPARPASAPVFSASAPARPAPDALDSSRGLRLTLLSIGAGQAGLVRVPGGQTFFIDCGSTTVPDVFRRIIRPFLRHEGVRRVDDIYFSHGDYDHICAGSEIVEAYDVRQTRMTYHFRRHATGILPAEALLETLDRLNRPPALMKAGDRVDVGGGAEVRVVWPPRDCAMNSNNCGMVLRLTYAGRSILFPADIQEPPEWELAKRPQLIHSDVLVAPHHGSAEASTPAFLRAVDPAIIVASNDRKLTHKQKAFDEMAAKWPLYRTHRCGAIEVLITSEGKIEVETFTGAGPIGPAVVRPLAASLPSRR